MANRTLRWGLFVGVVFALVGVMLTMTSATARFWFFVGVLVVSVLLARWQQGDALSWSDMREALRTGWARLLDVRHHWLMPWLARLSALGALVSLLYAWHLFTPPSYRHQAIEAWNYVGLAFLLAILPLWYFLPRVVDARPVPALRPTLIHWRVVALGLVLWLILVQTTFIPPFYRGTLPHHVQAVLLVMSLLLVTLGLGGWQWHMLKPLRPRMTWLPVLGVLMLALLTRVYNLEYGIHRFVDEVHFASAVSRLWYGGEQALLMPHDGTTAFTWLYPYIQSLIAGLTSPSLTGLRLASVLLGVVQVWAIYDLTRHLLNRQAGFFVALTLATYPAHVHFSRLGLNNIADPTFALLGLAFFVRGLRQRRQMDFAISGVMLGLTAYFYEGGRLFYAPFVALWLVWLVLFVRRDATFRRPHWHHWSIFLAGAVGLIGSFYYVWATNLVRLFPRYDAVGGNFFGIFEEILAGDSWRVFWDYLQIPLLSYVHVPSIDSFFHGSQPFVLWALVPLFLLGWMVSLWRVRHLDGSLVFWWMSGVVVAMMAFGPSSHSPRHVVGHPAVAMCVGLGAYWLVVWSGRMMGRLRRRNLQRFLSSLFIGIICTTQTLYFHGDFLPMYYHRQFYNEFINGIRVRDADDVMFRAVRLPAGTHVHFIAREFFGAAGYGAILSYYGRSQDLRFSTLLDRHLNEAYLLSLSPTVTHAFFIEPDDSATYTLLTDFFDLTGPEFSPYPIPVERQMALYMAYPSERSLNDPRRWRHSGAQTP